MTSGAASDEERGRALALLEATHTFPTEYYVSVIAESDPAVEAAVARAAFFGLAAPVGPEAHATIPSREGKYTSHRLRVPCARAEDVLDLYARLRAVPGVRTLL